MIIIHILLHLILCFQWTLSALSSKNIIDPYFEKKFHYNIGIVLYKDFSLLDVIGPAETFGNVKSMYTLTTIGDGVVASRYNNIKVIPKVSMKQAQEIKFDILIMPGLFKETYDKLNDNNFLNSIKLIASKATTVFSVGTGSLLLAKTGLINGMVATTTKQAYNILTPQFPEVKWIKKARWTHNQKFICASGVTAGIDASSYIQSLAFGNLTAIIGGDSLEWEVNWDPENDPFFDVVGSNNPFAL